MERQPSLPCTNCGEGPVGEFCAACGQRRLTPESFTARAFLRETVSEMISVDGRFLHTLWTLIRHPGMLAREYFDGRGASYMRPLNLFLLLNLVFFIVQPHTGLLRWTADMYWSSGGARRVLINQTRADRADVREAGRRATGLAPRMPVAESLDQFGVKFDAKIQDYKKSMLLVAIPLFALALAVTYVGQGRRMAEHLIFTTHFYAYAVFVMTVVVQAAFAAARLLLDALHATPEIRRMVGGEVALTLFLFVVLGSYLYVGLRQMYGGSRLAAGLRTVALVAWYDLLVLLFANWIFRLTLATM